METSDGMKVTGNTFRLMKVEGEMPESPASPKNHLRSTKPKKGRKRTCVLSSVPVFLKKNINFLWVFMLVCL